MCVVYRISETTGILTLIKPLDHENAAVILTVAEVRDLNADLEFANQTDTGKTPSVSKFLQLTVI